MRIGAESNTLPLRSVLVKSPETAHGSQAQISQVWRDLNYPAEPLYQAAVAEHRAFVARLREAGAEPHALPADPSTGPDSIFVHDSLLVTRSGAILCRMSKEARRGEPNAAERWLAEEAIPVLGRIEGEATLEGGDLIWLDDRTVAVGEGYRTNAEGIRQVGVLLEHLVDEVITVPLPHWAGPQDCLHLMSLVSPIDNDLAVVYSPLLPVPFRRQLERRGIRLVEVPEGEFDTMGCNVLAVGPRQCLMLEGNPITRQRLEEAGATVMTYVGSEISLKGGGGPTCLTRPLVRS